MPGLGGTPTTDILEEGERVTDSQHGPREVSAGPCPPSGLGVLRQQGSPLWGASRRIGEAGHPRVQGPCGPPSPTCGDVVGAPLCLRHGEVTCLLGVTGQSLQVPTPCPPAGVAAALRDTRGAVSHGSQPC